MKKTILKKECVICKKVFEKPMYVSVKNWHERTKMCSKQCRIEYTARKNKGGNAGSFSREMLLNKENHPRWKGGISRKAGYCTPYKTNYKAKNRHDAVGKITNDEWSSLKKKFGNKCVCCGDSEKRVSLEIDHVIPLSKNGSNYISNIQPLCSTCNRKKGGNFIDYRLQKNHGLD